MNKAVKILKIAFVVLSAFFAVVYICAEIMKLPMNSDSACMMLEADDILSGNLFLRGWNLTGVSFLTTDLPWFVIGTAVFDVGLNAFRLTVFMMYIFMVLSAAPLVFYKINDKFKAYCVFLGVGVVPTTYALSHAFVHTAGFAVSFLMIFAAMLYGEKPTKSRMALLVLMCAFGACGDRISLAVALVPLMAVCVFGGTKNPKKMLCGMGCGAVLGVFTEKAYLFVGGAKLNSLPKNLFSQPADIPRNIASYIEAFLRLINANFFGKELFSIKTGVFAFKIILVIFAVFAVYKLFLKRKEKSFSVTFPIFTLSIGFVLMTALMFLTEMGSNVNSGRYFAYLPLMLSVILAKTLDGEETAVGCLSNKYGVCAVFLLLAATCFVPHGSSFSPENAYSRLASYLESQNLTRGYATFWDSSVVDAYSENHVKLTSVVWEESEIRPMLWFNNARYDEAANFVVVRLDGNKAEEENYRYNGIFTQRLDDCLTYGVTEDNVKTACGEPVETKKFENYLILIYENIPLDKEELWVN